MRLIDADLLSDQFDISDADLKAKEKIDDAPTVDAVVVTRLGRFARSAAYSIVILMIFCSYGEPKEG